MAHLLKKSGPACPNQGKATGRHRAGLVPGDGCSAQMKEKEGYRRAEECATGLYGQISRTTAFPSTATQPRSGPVSMDGVWEDMGANGSSQAI
jgi:hypothetical protein